MRGRRLALGAAALSASACSGPGPVDAGRDDAPATYQVAIVQPSAGGALTPLDATHPLEIHLGFQGFIYARVVFAARGDVPAQTDGHSTLDLDGAGVVDQPLRGVRFGPAVDGVRYSDPLLLYENDVLLSAVQGRSYRLSLALRSGSQVALASAAGTVFYDVHCVDDGNGACLPSDAGPSPDAALDGAADGGDLDASLADAAGADEDR